MLRRLVTRPSSGVAAGLLAHARPFHGGPDWKDRPPHRFTEGTLNEGQHRVAPQAAHRAWVDARSPVERARQWLLDPMPTYITYSVIFLAFLMLYYNGMQARDTAWIQTNTNHLHRSLAMETAKHEQAKSQVAQLEREVAELQMAANKGNKSSGASAKAAAAVAPSSASGNAPLEASDPALAGQSRHVEVELNRERKRATQLTERVGKLVNELAELRSEATTLRGTARDLEIENKKLKTLLGRLDG